MGHDVGVAEADVVLGKGPVVLIARQSPKSSKLSAMQYVPVMTNKE